PNVGAHVEQDGEPTPARQDGRDGGTVDTRQHADDEHRDGHGGAGIARRHEGSRLTVTHELGGGTERGSAAGGEPGAGALGPCSPPARRGGCRDDPSAPRPGPPRARWPPCRPRGRPRPRTRGPPPPRLPPRWPDRDRPPWRRRRSSCEAEGYVPSVAMISRP